MRNRFLWIATITVLSCSAQIQPAPNTQPKPVNDPLNTNNITGDTPPTGGSGTITGGNPGIGSNPSAGISDQMREAADQIFASNLALQALTEVALDKLAATNASSDAVKTYAAQMMESNTKMSERLKRQAARGHVTIPAALDAKYQARIDRLAKLNGADFDRAFAREQVQSGERNLKAFEQEIQNGSDAGLRTLATRATPSIQKQLQDAKELEKTLKAK